MFITRREEITLFLGALVLCFAVIAIGLLSLTPMFAVFFGGLTIGLFVAHTISDQIDRKERAEKINRLYEASKGLNKVFRERVAAEKRWPCVYIIQDIDVTGYCKIGFTVDPSNRIGHFDTMLPFNVAVLHIIPCKEPQKTEGILHRRFAEKRVRGEWFNLSKDDLLWIMDFEKA